MTPDAGRRSVIKSSPLGLVVAVLALILAALALLRQAPQTPRSAPESALARILTSRLLRAGYSGFRPYTIINPGAQPEAKVSGFCVDLINEMARRQTPPWEVEWHQVTFETLKADMDSHRFDVFADAVYQTLPRAAEFGFTTPYGYFGVAVAVVRKAENRFKVFEDLDRPDITIALAQGWTSTEYAQQHLAKPHFTVMPVADDPFIPLQEVVSGRADAALQDVPTVAQFVASHGDVVKALWLTSPPTRVPAGFMTRRDDLDLLGFLNVSLKVLEADGTMAALDKKWRALNEFPVLATSPGTGLRQ